MPLSIFVNILYGLYLGILSLCVRCIPRHRYRMSLSPSTRVMRRCNTTRTGGSAQQPQDLMITCTALTSIFSYLYGYGAPFLVGFISSVLFYIVNPGGKNLSPCFTLLVSPALPPSRLTSLAVLHRWKALLCQGEPDDVEKLFVFMTTSLLLYRVHPFSRCYSS